MVALSDRLEYVLGAKAAGQLEEYFGIRTVNDLVRHYPRKYNTGSTVLEEDDEPPEEGEHVTFVDTITKAEPRWTNRKPKREFLVITLGHRRPKVTATFFNAKYLKRGLVEGVRVILSGEVGYYKGTMQLTHPAFLILDSGKGSRSLAKIAETSRDSSGEVLLEGFERDFFPIYPASCQAAELGYLRLRAPSARRARPCRRSVAGICSQSAESDVGGRSASRDPPVGERSRA